MDEQPVKTLTNIDIESFTFEQLVELAKTVESLISFYASEIEDRKKSLDWYEEMKKNIYNKILQQVKERNIKDEKVGNNYVTYFSKEEVTWLDDAGLLAALKKNDAKQFINTTTTIKESVDKKELKKAFKTDESLKETYKNFYGTKLTEYVTITTEENHEKMIEHVAETEKNKKEKE